jgi:RNA recognition motif-containing protein
MNIYVGNLPYSTSEDDLRDLFSQHGAVQSVNIISDRDTGRSKGFGFVIMDEAAEAQNAIKALDGHEMDGRALRINEARPREDRPRSKPAW